MAVDNFTESEEKRRQLIIQIQELHKGGTPIREIARIMGKDRKTVKKYLNGDPGNLCRSNKHGAIGEYDDLIIKAVENGYTQSSITKMLIENGYHGTGGNARYYIRKVALKYGLELSKYCPKCQKHTVHKEKK